MHHRESQPEVDAREPRRTASPANPLCPQPVRAIRTKLRRWLVAAGALTLEGCATFSGDATVHDSSLRSNTGPGGQTTAGATAEAHGEASARDASGVICDRLIDDFSGTPPGQFPRGWRTRDEDELPQAKREKLYVVEQEGNRRVLHATYRDQAITIGRPVADWDLLQYPILSWEWRAVELPKNASEVDGSRNDSSASVYAIWEVGFPFHVDGIRYAWSTTLDVGTYASKRLGHDQILILESGTRHRGTWRTAQVNVHDHHARFFDRTEPRSPSGIALLTDADATASSAEAYYANFRLCRTSEPVPRHR